MSDAEIKVGDVVRLQSGSDNMTVQFFTTQIGVEKASVVWEDRVGVHHTAEYAVAALRHP